ncbi:MAG: hypothetical protein AABY28_04430 [Candidatus Omnitrophota bacterium]
MIPLLTVSSLERVVVSAGMGDGLTDFSCAENLLTNFLCIQPELFATGSIFNQFSLSPRTLTTSSLVIFPITGDDSLGFSLTLTLSFNIFAFRQALESCAKLKP